MQKFCEFAQTKATNLMVKTWGFNFIFFMDMQKEFW